MKHCFIIIVSSILFLSCEDSVSPDYDLSEEFSIKLKTSASVDDGKLHIYFDDVNDSRCPKDVICVWGGEGKIKLALTLKNTDSSKVEIILPPGVIKKDTALHPVINFNNYKIIYMQLDPYPDSRVRIDPLSYRATLKVLRQ